MGTFVRLACLLISLGGGACFSLAGDSSEQAASPERVRAAVQRSLPYLEGVGTAWIRERKCNSCHNVTFLVWAHNAAAAQGLNVDRDRLAEWTKWSLSDSLSSRVSFKLRPWTIGVLKAEGMPAPVLAKLTPSIGQNFSNREQYLEELGKVLGSDDLRNWQEQLIRLGTLPRNGGGPETLSQLLLGRAILPEEPATATSYDAIRSLLQDWQEPDGSWQAQGQLPELKWKDAAEMHQATTMWSLLALSTANPQDEALLLSRQRGLSWLQESEPGVSLQSLALHLIMAQRFGHQERAQTLLRDLYSRQNRDGGWGWTTENQASEAFSTGQALYALGQVRIGNQEPAVRRAWEFLLRTQREDGSWDVPQEAINTRPRKLNVYPFWGSAWAVIGLLQTLADPDQKR